VALGGAIQPRAESTTVTGSFSIIASIENSRVGAASAIVVRRRPRAVSGPYSLRSALRSRLSRVRWRAGLSSSLLRSSCSASRASRSRRSSISSSLRSERSRMLRMASAWRSVRPNSAIITGLGSSSVRMISMIRSRLR
jgi:hypothetical protein